VRRLVPLATIVVASLAAAATVDPSALGPSPVGVTTRTFVDASRGRTLVTEVWYPARAAGRDVPVRRGHYPLVLLAHGYCGFRTNYEYLTGALASWGFVVAAPDFPVINKTDCDAGVPETADDLFTGPPADLSFLRTAFHDTASPARDFVRFVHGRRAGVVGHSLGGLTVVNASIADRELTAVVVLAGVVQPRDAQRVVALGSRRAVLVVVGTADTTVPAAPYGELFFAGLDPPAYLVTIANGTHSGFTDMDRLLTPEALARQETLTRRYTVAFLERHLVHARRFRGVLTPADAGAQGMDVTLVARPR